MITQDEIVMMTEPEIRDLIEALTSELVAREQQEPGKNLRPRLLSDSQMEILRHALGLDRSDTPTRNSYVTGPGERDFDDAESLVELGLMRTGCAGSLIPKTYNAYYVTEAGKDLVLAKQDIRLKGENG